MVEGAIPTAENGIYGTIAGRTMLDICTEVLPKAKAVVAYGTCACFGGIPAAAPNPTGAKGVNACFADKGIKAINIAGCPPNPLNIVGHACSGSHRPEHRTRSERTAEHVLRHVGSRSVRTSPHFEAGEFAPSFDSEEARNGWCLYELGCKGPLTFNNCPKARFNNGANWPVGAGHPCIGCSEDGFWDTMTPFYEN